MCFVRRILSKWGFFFIQESLPQSEKMTTMLMWASLWVCVVKPILSEEVYLVQDSFAETLHSYLLYAFWDHSSTQQTIEQGEKQGTLNGLFKNFLCQSWSRAQTTVFFLNANIYLAQCGKVQSFGSWRQEWLHPWKISDHLKAPSHV